jgi:hypothetical protein
MLFALVWLLLLLPIRFVTRDVEAESPAQKTAEGESRAEKVWLSLRFSSLPAFFEITQSGRSIWRMDEVTETFYEESLSVEVDEFGLELGFMASFAEEDVAVEVALEASGRDRQSRTLWVSGEVDELVSFSWSRDE